MVSILLLAIGLSMDAMAVAAARGLATPELKVRHALIVSTFFGGFQAGMPLLGWLLGTGLGPLIAAWDHWIAFVLLAGIGLKMLHEAWSEDVEAEEEIEGGNGDELYGARVMIVLALATSMDAFAAGMTLPALGVPVGLSLATIGITTGVLSALGLVLGRRFGALFGHKLDAFGGLVLIGLGAKVLIEHLAG